MLRFPSLNRGGDGVPHANGIAKIEMAAAGSLLIVHGRCVRWAAYGSKVPTGLQRRPKGTSAHSILVER